MWVAGSTQNLQSLYRGTVSVTISAKLSWTLRRIRKSIRVFSLSSPVSMVTVSLLAPLSEPHQGSLTPLTLIGRTNVMRCVPRPRHRAQTPCCCCCCFSEAAIRVLIQTGLHRYKVGRPVPGRILVIS